MAVSRTLVAIGASGLLGAGALASGPPRDYCPTNGVSVRIGIGSGYSNYRYGSNYRSSYYRGSGSHYYGSRRGYGSSVHYRNTPAYCPPPRTHVVYDHRPVYQETHVYRKPASYQPSRVVTVYGNNHDRSYGRVTIDQAWKQLGRGDSRTALNSFSTLAEASPYKALPKVGYALACAERGDLEGAIHAMRRAYAADANAIHYFPRDERLLRLVQNLEYRYIERSEVAYANPDYHFMIAALAFLRHDMDRAWIAVNKAEDHRDRSKGTRELRRVIEKYRSDGY